MKAAKKPVKPYGPKTKATTKPEVKPFAPNVMALTPAEYGGLQAAYDFFNRELFASELPDVFITYQRKAHSAGHFSADRYSLRAGEARHHELSLNPDGFLGHSDKDICDTLVHEMCHAWQQHCGKPPSRGYHDKQWAAKMKSVGLQPSNTGIVGGKETGAHMSDYPIPNGPFEKTFAKLAAMDGSSICNLRFAPERRSQFLIRKPSLPARCVTRTPGGKPDLQICCQPCTVGAFDQIIARLTDPKQIKSAENSRDQITGHAQMRAEVTAPVSDRTNDYDQAAE